ncbi:long chain acyl-CoA synthetase [Trifolium repens]|nr:long chain acyl-CoA synthetase [Trifolium repens]
MAQKRFIIEVEKAKEATEDRPIQGLDSCWDVFRLSIEKYPNNHMLCTRENVDGKHGKYKWQTYQEVYDMVIKDGNSIRSCGYGVGGSQNFDLPITKRTDICTIMYTSGTTGDPKGVLISNESIITLLAGVKRLLESVDEKLFEKDASGVGMLNCYEDLKELKPTIFCAVPRVLDRVYSGLTQKISSGGFLEKTLLNFAYSYKLYNMKKGHKLAAASPLLDKVVFDKVKQGLGGHVRVILSGAAPLSMHVESYLRVVTCSHVLQGYGLTETSVGTFVSLPNELDMLGTVGPPVPNVDACLESVPEMGYDALANTPRGEICVKGDTLFSRYYKREDFTKEVLVDGWFYTGDIGEWQPNGSMKIIDRKKNIFKLSQGEYVAVENLENIFSQVPSIESAYGFTETVLRPSLLLLLPPANRHLNIGQKKMVYPWTSILSEDSRAKQYILEELSKIGKEKKLKGFKFIKAVHLDLVPLDMERDLITPTYNKKRPQLLKYYQFYQLVRPTGSIEGEPVMMEKEIPTFDGTGDAYWWLIKMDWYFQANSWILEKMKLNLVTLFALRGDAYMWWSSRKQGNHNITWKTFERGFIKKFIPELWEMMEAAEEVSREEIQKVKTEIGDDIEKEKLQVSEPSNRKLQSHKESVVRLDATIEKKEADNRAVNVKVNQVVEIDSPPLSELPKSPPLSELPKSPPDVGIQAMTLPKSKPPNLEAETDNVELNNHRHGMPRPPSKPPDARKSATLLPQRVPPPKLPGFARDVVLLPSPQPPEPSDTGSRRMCFFITEGEKDLEKVRVKWEINEAVRENESMDKVCISFNPIGRQTHTNFCRILKVVTIWAGIELLDWVQFNDSNGVLKEGVCIFEDTNLKEQDKGANWSCCKLGPTENQIGQAQTNIGLLEDDFRAWTDISEFLLKHNMHINSACFIVTEGMYGMCLTHELAVSFIYSLMQEGSNCLKYTLVSTDMGIEVVLTLEALNHVDYYFENCHLFKIHLSLGSIVGKYKGIRVLYLKVENVVDVGVRCFEKYRGFSGLITNYQFEGTIIERDFVVVSFLDYAMACMTKVNTVGLEMKCTFDLHERVHKIKSNKEAITIGRKTTLLSRYWKTYYCDLNLVKNTRSALSFVYDRGKLWKILFDVGKHILDIITLSLQICMRWLFFGFMSQTQVYHHHRKCNETIENDMWSFKKLVTLPNAMRAIIEVYWRIIFISHGLFNFVFDRGKFDGCKISTLRTRLFEGVGIDRDLNCELGLDFGPSLRCGKEEGKE